MYKLRNIIKKYISDDKNNEIMDFLNNNNINDLEFIEDTIIPLKLYSKNKVGGKNNKESKDEFLDKNKYQIKIYKYIDPNEKNYKTMNFLKIESVLQENGVFSNGDHCAILILDTKINESNIQSVNNYKDCIKCYDDKNNMYKIGDILVQVMIYMSINKGMKKINLHDNSHYKCHKHSIPLINLRTMTHGIPLYSKYGFKPINHNKEKGNIYSKDELQIYTDNKKIFLTNPKMSKKELLKIIFYTNFDNKKDNEMLNYINNIVVPRLKENNNLISEFLNDIIKDSKDDKKIILIEACKLLKNIFIVIYNKCGYYDYIEKTFELNLENKKTNQYLLNRIKIKMN